MPATSQESAARRYRIEKYLTEGGMGAIYIGKKLGPGGFAKEVVLKQLLPEYTSRPEFRDLFFREAKISATLDHANIVHTFDLVESDQSLFIVMEYVRGADLRTIIRRARHRQRELSPAAAIHIALEILSGLGYAHTRRDSTGKSLDIIHRDVSPSNIICSVEGAAKLSDFGIAKASTYSSVFYRVRGKVGYMSPEQARSQQIDHRCDLFSLSVCLYESLTGERLFVGDLNTPADEIYGIRIAPVSHKRGGLPTALDEVMARALSPNVDHRYQSAAELAEALRTVAHRTGLAFSAPELAAHLRDILGEDPERWLRDEPAAVADPLPGPAGGSELVGTEAASIGIVSDIADDEPGQSVLSPRAVSGSSKNFDLDSMLNDEATRPGGQEDEPERSQKSGQASQQASTYQGKERRSTAPTGSTENDDGSVRGTGTPPPVWTRDSRPFEAAPTGPPAGVPERRVAQSTGTAGGPTVPGVRAAAPINLPGILPIPAAGRNERPLPRATIRSAAVPPPFVPIARPAVPAPPPPPFPRGAAEPRSVSDDIEEPTPRPKSGTAAAFAAVSSMGSSLPQPSSFDIEDPSTPAPPVSRTGGAPPPGFRGSPPASYPVPAFDSQSPSSQPAGAPRALQLKPPETIDFHDAVGALLPEKTGGPPRWLATLMILGSVVGGAALAHRVTRAQMVDASAQAALAGPARAASPSGTSVGDDGTASRAAPSPSARVETPEVESEGNPAAAPSQARQAPPESPSAKVEPVKASKGGTPPPGARPQRQTTAKSTKAAIKQRATKAGKRRNNR